MKKMGWYAYNVMVTLLIVIEYIVYFYVLGGQRFRIRCNKLRGALLVARNSAVRTDGDFGFAAYHQFDGGGICIYIGSGFVRHVFQKCGKYNDCGISGVGNV